MEKAAVDSDDPHPDVIAVVGDDNGSRRRSASRLHDPNVTFEEYYYYARLSRAHPSESDDTPSPASKRRIPKFLPFKRKDVSTANHSAPVIEKNSDGSSPAQSWHNVSDEERFQASRALRTATWGALDSDRYPLRCYGDIAYRVAGSIARHTVNIFQSVQLLFNVGISIIQNGQGLAQISKGSVCFIILCFVWAIAGAVLGQIRTLRRLGWLAHAAIWLNVLTLIITTAVVFHSDPNYDAALANNNAAKGPKVTTADPPEGVGFEGQVVGLMQAVYSYGGVMLTYAGNALCGIHGRDEETVRFLETHGMGADVHLLLLHDLWLLGLFPTGPVHHQPNYQGVSPYAWQTAVNAIALVTALIAALLYSNIGIKVLYSNVFMELFGFPSLAQKSGKLLWVAFVPVYWGLAFVVAAAIPSISNLSGLIAAVCILQFSYTFPPLLMLFHCAQRDAIQEGVEGFDPSTGQTIRQDSGMSRWMRGLRKHSALNAFNFRLQLGKYLCVYEGPRPNFNRSAGLPNPFRRSITQDVVGSDVRLTVTVTGRPIIHPDRMEALIGYGIMAIGNSIIAAGGDFKDVGQHYLPWSFHQLTLNITDLTMQDPQPESAGGRMKWRELRAAYQGIGAVMKKLNYPECNVEFWRTTTGGFPRRLRKIKNLGIGTLRVTVNEPDSATPHGKFPPQPDNPN
ncbi:MAG: hypothetical protein Q9221_004815 [Calogaya cf. arnoldii]